MALAPSSLSILHDHPIGDAASKPVVHDEAVNRIKSMVREVPGSEWTAADAAKLSGLEPSVCRDILDRLEHAGFLARRSNGAFVRSTLR